MCGFYVCVHCWPAPMATTPPTATIRDRYRDMAKTLGFEGHIGWAEAMP